MICFHLLGMPINAFAAEGTNAVSVGVSRLLANDTSGFTDGIGYEKRILGIIAVYATIGNIDYRYEKDSHVETARGTGGEIGALLYPFRQSLKEWYFGVGWGTWSVKGNWQDDVGTPFVTSGTFRSSIDSFRLQTGYKWYFGSHNIFIDPRLQIGDMFGDIDSKAFAGHTGFVDLHVSIGITW